MNKTPEQLAQESADKFCDYWDGLVMDREEVTQSFLSFFLEARQQPSEDTERLVEALSWALDILDLTNAHLKKIDPESWKLDWQLDEFCNAKARKALADAARDPASTKKE
jgi:hypothetical protein